MLNRFVRILPTLSLIFGLWMSAPTVFAAQEKQEQKKSEQKAEQKSDSKPAIPTTTTAQQTQKRPLSVNEDPSMIGKRNINKGSIGIVNAMSGSIEKDVAIGRQLAAEIDRQAKFVEDPLITEYVNRVGQNIVLHSDAKIPFTIKVIDSDEVNAFALPGGFFYVNKGLLLAADNEAELAGVMAHEIAHVAARHAAEQQAKGMLANIGLIVGSIFLGGVPGAILNQTPAADIGLAMGFLKFNRGAEEEADRLGVQYLYASGYDPNAMATMFEKLAAKNKKKPGTISKLFASHPQAPDRRDASLALVARFPEREEYVITTSEFQKVKSKLMRLSNARASTAGDISGSGDDGKPGRPTLKRRTPSGDDAGTGTQSPTTTTPSSSEPPKLKRTTEGEAGKQGESSSKPQ
jgi:beta-barrel assembly-enhancing protease